MGAAKKALGFGSVIGDLLTSVGYLLPGSLGMSMTNLGYRLRGGEVVVSRVESSASGGSAAAAVSQPTTRTQTGAVTFAGGLIRLWSQTPPIEPGQTLAVTLTLRPIKSKQTQQYFFRVISQAVDAEGVPSMIEQGNLEIKGLSIARRLLPFLVLVITLAVVLLLAALLAVNIGLIAQ